MNSPTQQAGVLTEIVITVEQAGNIVVKARGLVDKIFLVGAMELAKLKAANAADKPAPQIQVPTPDLARQLVP